MSLAVCTMPACQTSAGCICDRALFAPLVRSAALAYWRDKLWQAADSVGVKLTDEQLETMTIRLAPTATRSC